MSFSYMCPCTYVSIYLIYNRFAEITARIFHNAEVPVGLFTDYVPTPLIPYAVKTQKYAIGVMVTASHNPKIDNGYKVSKI